MNREENLKKINAELEKLSDEELEQVAGGNIGQTAEDKDLLKNDLLSKSLQEELEQVFGKNAENKDLLKKDLPVKYGGLLPDWLPWSTVELLKKIFIKTLNKFEVGAYNKWK